MNFFKKTFLLTTLLVAGTAGAFAADAPATPHQQFIAQLTLLRENKLAPAAALADTGVPFRQRAAIAYLLESKNPATGAMLEKFLPTAGGQTAVEVMGALAEIKQTSALPAIRAKLENDADSGVKTEALICLGLMGAPEDVALLLGYFGKDGCKTAAEQSLYCISGVGTADAFSKIIGDAKNDAAKRKALITIATRRPLRQTLPALAENLTDADEAIRNESLKAITRLATDENFDMLSKAAEKVSDKAFRKRVDAAIKKLKK